MENKIQVEQPTNGTILLEMKGICKQFPGVKALDNVQLTIKAGTVHALMGENGAGKSTLMKCLFGIYDRDEGDVLLEGKSVNFHSSKEALEHGVAMVHQELNQALTRNVNDNLWMGRYPTVLGGLMVNEKAMTEQTTEVFRELGIDVNPKTKMSTMPVAQRQMVEIAKAVSYDARIVVFDEPTSSLTEAEVEHLFRIINKLRAQGCGIIYISHKMEEILRISDEVTIMRDGQYVATKDAKGLTTDEIIRLMVGRELTNRYPTKTNVVSEEPILEVDNLNGRYNIVRDVTFDVKKGEVLGFAGLAGAGRTETIETIFGYAKIDSGVIKKDGKIINIASPRKAIANGIALLTEERRASGIFGELDIKLNTVLANLDKYLIGKVMLNDKKMTEDTNWSIDAMSIKTPSQKTKIKSLSGGNQQKVILGRWLLTEPDVLLLDEPTRGIDVGAKYEIYQLINNLAVQGKAVVVVSSEMPELMGICDRIVVMSNGRIAGIVDAKTTSQEEILELAAKFI